VQTGLCPRKCQNAPHAALAPGQNINLASTYVIAMQAALNCAGMALTHEILVRDYLENGTLVAPFQTKLTLNKGYYLLPMAQYAETPAAVAFLDWLFSELWSD
jgi:LysR family glycine cleavage system transcriptional activator